MNEIEFMAVLLARNELAHVVCAELDKLRAGRENKFNEVFDGWMGFVHAVLYENDAKASIFRGNDGSRAFSKQADEQIRRFCSTENAEVRRALMLHDMQ